MPDFKYLIIAFLILFTGFSCKKDAPAAPEVFELKAVYVGNQQLPVSNQAMEIPIDLPIELIFTAAVDPATVENGISFQKDGAPVAVTMTTSDANVRVSPQVRLEYGSTYTLSITNALKSKKGTAFTPDQLLFKTQIGFLELKSITIDDQIAPAGAYL